MPTPGAATDGWPVGLLFSGRSLTAAVERSQHCATLLAIEEVNAAGGVGGAPLVPHLPEIGSRPDDYRRAAERLADEKSVRVFFGTHMSNARKAVLPVVESRDALLLYPTLYEGFEFSNHCVYTGAAPNQNCVQLARHLLRCHGGRGFFIGHNYVYAHESNRIMRDLVEDGGGIVTGECYLPFSASSEDIAAVMARACGEAPDFIYSTVVGRDIVRLHEAFARTPLRRRGVPIASLATNEADLVRMSADLSEGCLVSAPYFGALDTPASRRFVTGFQQRFGDETAVTAGAEAAYFQVHLFAQAAREARTGTPADLVSALAHVSFEAPQGRVRIDGATHHTWLRPRLGRGNARQSFDVLEEESGAVRPEPYMVEHRLEEPTASHG